MVTQTTSIKLEASVKERLERLGERRKRTQHWLIREAIEQYVEREELRATFLADAVKAWEDYEITGLHVTQEEADRWLADLEDGKDVAPPACHA